MSRYPIALILLLLVGCQSAPSVSSAMQPVPHLVTRYLPVPDSLTRPCPIAGLDDRSVESVVRAANARRLALEHCNAQLREIRKLDTQVSSAPEASG